MASYRLSFQAEKRVLQIRLGVVRLQTRKVSTGDTAHYAQSLEYADTMKTFAAGFV